MVVSALESLDLAQGVSPGMLARATGGQQQMRPVVRAYQLSGHQEDALAQGLKGSFLHLRWPAQSLEPVDEIVGEQEKMKVRLVGKEVARGDGAKRVIAFELSDDELDARPIVVETPEVQRLQHKVRDEDLVVIASELEQSQLRGRFFGLRSADHDEAEGARPAVRLITELGRLHAAADGAITQRRELALDRLSQPRDDHKAGALELEPLDQRMVVKPLVCPHYHALSRIGALGKAGLQQSLDPTGGVGVAGPQLPVPVILALALEAQQGVIGRSTALDRVVTDSGVLLLTVENQYGRVHIEQQSGRPMGSIGHTLEELVVQRAQARPHARRCAQQKPTQACCLRIARQSSQILEDAVLSQQLCRLEPFEAEEHRVEDRQQHLADAVAVVALLEADLLRDRVFEPDARQKAVQQVDASVVRQILRTKLDGKLARSAGHYTKPYFSSSFRCNAQKSSQSRFSGSEDRLA